MPLHFNQELTGGNPLDNGSYSVIELSMVT